MSKGSKMFLLVCLFLRSGCSKPVNSLFKFVFSQRKISPFALFWILLENNKAMGKKESPRKIEQTFCGTMTTTNKRCLGLAYFGAVKHTSNNEKGETILCLILGAKLAMGVACTSTVHVTYSGV